MVAAPDHHLAPLLGQPRIEVRVVDPREQQTIHRYDDQMLLTLRLAGDVDEPPPLLHIRRRAEGGLFDRLVAHVDDSWERATNPAACHDSGAGQFSQGSGLTGGGE